MAAYRGTVRRRKRRGKLASCTFHLSNVPWTSAVHVVCKVQRDWDKYDPCPRDYHSLTENQKAKPCHSFGNLGPFFKGKLGDDPEDGIIWNNVPLSWSRLRFVKVTYHLHIAKPSGKFSVSVLLGLHLIRTSSLKQCLHSVSRITHTPGFAFTSLAALSLSLMLDPLP